MITPASPIIGPATGSPETVLSWLQRTGKRVERPAELSAYLHELYRLCALVGFNADILAAQAAHESADWSDASPWWPERLNCFGLGVTGTPSQDAVSPTFATGEDAARAHVVHMAAYVFAGTQHWTQTQRDAVYRYVPLDPRFYAVAEAGFMATVTVLGDLGNGRWAVDPEYAAHITRVANTIFKESPMPTPPSIDFSRLPFPMRINYVPKTQTNNRPGIPMDPTSGTWHETANYNAGADTEMHERWLLNGAPGAAGAQVGVHAFIDDDSGVLMIPINEVAWHAGDGSGPGNYSSIAVECCVNSDGDLRKAQRNTAAFFGLLIAEDIIETVWQHNHWSGKDCPRLLRQGTGGYTWTDALGEIAAFAKQYATPAPPPPPTPSPIWWTPGAIGPQRRAHDGAVALAMLGEVKAKRNVPVRRDADSKSPVVDRISKGETRKIVGTYRGSNRWVFVEVAPGQYGRALWSAFYERFPTT